MSSYIAQGFIRLLNIFEETWVQREALRMTHDVGFAGDARKWEKIVEASQLRAQELFQPAVLAIQHGEPVATVVEKLLERLSREPEPPASCMMIGENRVSRN